MAGQGDLNRPDTWTNSAPTIGVGVVTGPSRQGGLSGEAGSPTDPDSFFGSFTLQAVPSTLSVGALAAIKGQGDVGDVFGTPDVSVGPPMLKAGLIAWNSVASTLGVALLPAPVGQGPVQDPQTWNSGVSTIGVGPITMPAAQGDIMAIYSPTEQWAGVNSTWQTGIPTIGTGTVAPTSGRGDIEDPNAWSVGGVFASFLRLLESGGFRLLETTGRRELENGP